MEPIKEFLTAHWADILGAIVVIRVIAAIARTRVPNDSSKADGVLDVIAGPDSEPPVAAPSTDPVTLDLTRDVPPALQPAVAPPANSNPDPPEAA